MESLINIINSYKTGDPLTDTVLLGILFVIFNAAYTLLFTSVFSWFHK